MRDNATPAMATSPADAGWTLFTCEVDLNVGPLDALTISGDTNTPGWRVILVEENAPNTPGLLDASNNRLDLNGFDGESNASFLIGVQPSCTAFASATIEINLSGTRDDGARVEITGSVTLTVPADAPPVVTLESLALSADGEDTVAAIDLAYANAPTACGWQLLVTLDAGDDAAIAIDRISGPAGTSGAVANGVISLLVLATDEPDGTIRIDARIAGDTDATVETVIVEAVTFP